MEHIYTKLKEGQGQDLIFDLTPLCAVFHSNFNFFTAIFIYQLKYFDI